MKILFTGAGSGGHFYPLIAVAEAVNDIVRERKLLPPSLYFLGPTPYDAEALFQNGITFRQTPAGKIRRYFSLLNIVDVVKTGVGILTAIWEVFSIYPDVIFSKGGYSSFPTVVAARLFRIPLVIHESDTSPGKVTRFAARFAQRIAIAYPGAEKYFTGKKVALVGNPIRKSLLTVAHEGAHEFLKLSPQTPTILILGGSQGAQILNDIVLTALPELLERYQVIHQTGEKLYSEVEKTSRVILEHNLNKDRYKIFPYLNELAMRMAAGVAAVIVSRGGSQTIFEIAQWGIPSIIVPLPTSVSRDQQENAYTYARSGGAEVIEQSNFTAHLLVSEIDRLIADPALRDKMGAGAHSFAKPEAARVIAEALIDIALKHEAP